MWRLEASTFHSLDGVKASVNGPIKVLDVVLSSIRKLKATRVTLATCLNYSAFVCGLFSVQIFGKVEFNLRLVLTRRGSGRENLQYEL